MGWNAGFTAMEAAVIRLYDQDKLTDLILDAVMEPYKNTDCDFGGCMDLKAHDGLGIMEVICKVMKPKEYQAVLENPKWFKGQEPGTEAHENLPTWKSNEALYDLFQSIWTDMWCIF